MFRIGEFSRLAQVSASQLRNYDQLGLFIPEEVDPQTGYRLYSAEQLPQLNRIIALKEMGLSLAQIKRLVDEEISADELRGMLLMKKAQIEQTLHEEAARLRYIESRIEQINLKGNMENYDIVLKSVPAKNVLTVRSFFPMPQAVRHLLREMQQRLPAVAAKSTIGHLTAIMHSQPFTEENLDIELGFELKPPIDEALTVPLSDARALVVNKLPAEKHMLTVTRVGHPKTGHGSYSALGMWAQANGYRFEGPVREVFIHLELSRFHETVTEIQYPVQPIENPAKTA